MLLRVIDSWFHDVFITDNLPGKPTGLFVALCGIFRRRSLPKTSDLRALNRRVRALRGRIQR